MAGRRVDRERLRFFRLFFSLGQEGGGVAGRTVDRERLRFFRLFFSFGREVWLGEQAIGRGSDFSDYSFLSRGDVAGRRVER